MQSFEPKHLLNAQRQARKARITDPTIRKHLNLLPLEQRVKSPSSVSSSNKSSSYVSPALQSSQERPPHKPTRSPHKHTRSPHKPTLPSAKTPRPSAKGTQNSKKQALEQEHEPELQVKRIDLGPLDSLPKDLITKILTMSTGIDITAYSLRTWIDPDKLQLVLLTENPNSISFFDTLFKLDPEADIPWNLLSKNPNAIELLKKRMKYLEEKKIDINNLKRLKQFNWERLSKNPNAIELLEQKIEEEKFLVPNTLANLTDYQKIDWNKLCMNPNAIALLKANIPKITKSIFANKNIDEAIITTLLTQRAEFQNAWHIPQAIQFLTTNKSLQEILTAKNILWNELSRNTSSKAITLLKAKAKIEKLLIDNNFNEYKSLPYSLKIDWNKVSSNPKAISLLETKAEEEKHLRDNDNDKYLALSDTERINWNKVSSNPKAISLLETKAEEEKKIRDKHSTSVRARRVPIWMLSDSSNEYKSLPYILKIDWDEVSSNPKAISLLETKAEEEKHLRNNNYEKYLALSDTERINWNKVSSNPKAISLLETKAEEEKIRDKNYEKYLTVGYFRYFRGRINWAILSSNPKAISLLETKAEDEKKIRDKNYEKYLALSDTELINWNILSSNPKAISLLETKAEEEMLEKSKRTSQELREYHCDSYACKIDPEKLSANPKAVKLLEKYPDYISITVLCSNPNAVKLIKKQVLFEKKLSEKELSEKKYTDRINWDILSKNPCIFYETS